MSVMRSLLLAGSESAWLKRRAPEMPFVRTAVRRFMPGDRLEDALAAAVELRTQGLGTVLTELGENVIDAAQADAVVRHYVEALDKTAAWTGLKPCATEGGDGATGVGDRATEGGDAGTASDAGTALNCHISLKLTQLGLDVDKWRCLANVRELAARAKQLGTIVWIDMEQYRYVDATLEIYRSVLAEYENVGVCLQAYLYRTAADLNALTRLGGGVRLVKGAYREGADVAYPAKRDVDNNFLELAKVMTGRDARASGFRAVFGTHDSQLISAIQSHMEATNHPRDLVEFHLLYGIQRAEQLRLARAGYRTRVLISYGEQWFPWYMRRLAERPADVLFVAKSMLRG